MTEKEGGRASKREGEREGYHYIQSALTNHPHNPHAWSKCDNCSQTPSESASRSSTPGKENVMATHKLRSPRATFIHTYSVHTHTLYLCPFKHFQFIPSSIYLLPSSLSLLRIWMKVTSFSKAEKRQTKSESWVFLLSCLIILVVSCRLVPSKQLLWRFLSNILRSGWRDMVKNKVFLKWRHQRFSEKSFDWKGGSSRKKNIWAEYFLKVTACDSKRFSLETIKKICCNSKKTLWTQALIM